jgi:hypothetical protein
MPTPAFRRVLSRDLPFDYTCIVYSTYTVHVPVQYICIVFLKWVVARNAFPKTYGPKKADKNVKENKKFKAYREEYLKFLSSDACKGEYFRVHTNFIVILQNWIPQIRMCLAFFKALKCFWKNRWRVSLFPETDIFFFFFFFVNNM